MTLVILTCGSCSGEFPETEFHKQPTGRAGRHSYCRDCANTKQRLTRVRNHTPEQKRKWLLKGRYNLTPEDVERMLQEQNGLCGICRKEMPKPCIDHCHKSGVVRGLLCKGCNLRLGVIDNEEYVLAALVYLQKSRDIEIGIRK